MRTRRLLVALGLALVLAVPGALAQDATVDTEARSGGQPLSQAEPLEPGEDITIATSVSTTGTSDRQWRVFVNATVETASNASSVENWTGEQTVEVTTSLQAPQEEGTYGLVWDVVVQSRTADSAWTDENRTQQREGFQVEAPPPPPSAENVTVDVRRAGGGSLDEIGNVSPNENIALEADVGLPERENTEWNVTLRAFVNDTRVAQAQQQASQGGELPFALQFNAPGSEGQHQLRWEVTVEYRNEGEQAWTELTTREGTTTFGVEPLAPEPGPGIPWLWILIGAAVVVGGGAGAYYMFRPPKQIKGEPRSQAMQDLEGGSAATAEPEEPEVHPQVKILEARAEDLRRMIELARERHEEGEITEHQFEQIKERKEAELEEVEAEIEEYRQQ